MDASEFDATEHMASQVSKIQGVMAHALIRQQGEAVT